MGEVAAGSVQARRVLAARLSARAQRVARAILGGHADADDAAQAGLVDVLRAASSFRGESSLEAWADRVVARAALAFARSRRARFARIDADASPDDFADEAAFAARRDAEDACDGETMAERLERLPAVCREVLVLRHVLGHSVAEIAEITDVSVNTVKDRLLRGREMLRRLVRRDEMLDAARRSS